MRRYRVDAVRGLTLTPGTRVGVSDELAGRFRDRLEKKGRVYVVTQPFDVKRGEVIRLDPDNAPKTVLQDLAEEEAARTATAPKPTGDPPPAGQQPADGDGDDDADEAPAGSAAGPSASGAATTEAPAEKAERLAQIADAIDVLGDPASEPGSFTQDGRPTIEALESVLGWKPSAAERDEVLAAEGAE